MWREVEVKEGDDRGEKRPADDDEEKRLQRAERFDKQPRLDSDVAGGSSVVGSGGDRGGGGDRSGGDRGGGDRGGDRGDRGGDRGGGERRFDNSDRRGGGGSGGGGDFNRNVVCHHCGEPGHIRPACPQLGRRSEAQVSICYNCKKEGHKIVDCPDPRKVCKWWPDCPNTNCSYYHPAPGSSGSGAASGSDRRSPPRSPRGRSPIGRSPLRNAVRSPPRGGGGGGRSPPIAPRGRSRSRDRSRGRSVRSRSRSRDRSPPRRSPTKATQIQQRSIRVSGLPGRLESAELGGLFPGTDIIAGAMIDNHAAVVIFKNERDREDALETANKLRFERL